MDYCLSHKFVESSKGSNSWLVLFCTECGTVKKIAIPRLNTCNKKEEITDIETIGIEDIQGFDQLDQAIEIVWDRLVNSDYAIEC